MLKKYLSLLFAAMLLVNTHSAIVSAEEEHDHSEETSGALQADDHHNHGTTYANFIPNKFLNPDDSVYEAPEATKDYVGLYTAQAEVEELQANVNITLSIEEDGIFNLAYYFVNSPEQTGKRFYATKDGQVEEVEAIYQDLVVLTGALREGEGGLGSGLIGKTISPVVLLDEDGNPDRLYPYMSLAFDLRENYANSRIYQSIGLNIAEDIVAIDVNHLIGLESDNQVVAKFEKVEARHEDEFLVATRTYELLQDSFDNDLIEHNDFKMDYQSANDFVQAVLAMHLRTNTSFPQDTIVELVENDRVELDEGQDVQYAMLINDSILYAYDGTKLFVAEEVTEENGNYSVEKWVTN